MKVTTQTERVILEKWAKDNMTGSRLMGLAVGGSIAFAVRWLFYAVTAWTLAPWFGDATRRFIEALGGSG